MSHTDPRASPLYRPASGRPAPDAAAEARRWLDDTFKGALPPPVLAVIGLENGDLLDVLDEWAPGTRVLGLEPDPAAAATFRARPAADRWLSAGRLVYLVDPDYAGSDRAWRLFDGTSHAILTHPRLSVDTEPSVRAARTLKNILFGAKANAAARRKFAPRYLVNALRNMPSMLRGRDVETLADAYRGVPAIITAAGPSLDGAIEELRSLSGRGLLIATDTSLRPLLHAGIVPPLVVALDPGAANARHFQLLPECRDTWLVSELAVDRRATAVFGERLFWFRAGDHQPWPLLAALGVDAARLDVWGSVLTGAYQVACLAGCDPIVFVGADLAYTDGRPYARGTTYEFDWAWHTGSGMALHDVWAEQIARRDLLPDRDLRGEPTMTTTSLLSFRDWLAARARQRPARVVNATGAGMLFGDGIEQRTLRDVLSSPVGIRPLSELPGRAPALRPSAVATRLRRLGAAVRAGDRSAPIDAWAAFSGEGFDPALVSAALDEAAHTIETRREGGGPAIPLAWLRFDALTTPAGFLAQLPEAMARFRSLFDAEAATPTGHWQPGCDPERLLDLALDVLSAIARHAPVDEAPTRPADASRPLSTQYAGPEHVRWAMQLFEGLLALAATRLPWHRQPTFLERPLIPRDTSESPASPRVETRNGTHALLLLAQWIRCAESLDPRQSVSALPSRVLGLETALRHGTSPPSTDAYVVVVDERSADRLRIPVAVPDAWLARALTGALLDEGGAETILGTLARPRVRMSLQRRTRRAARPAPAAPQLTLDPVVLTDRGVPQAAACYGTAEGVVCLSPDSRESFIVDETGDVVRGPSWPRVATSVLPLGDRGAVAWSWGDLAGGPILPYVMYRWSPDDEAVVEPLPFRPSRGVWWNGRLYWTCVPAGVGAWSPGTEPRSDLPDLSVAHIQPDGDALVLVPRVRGADGAIARRLLKEGVRWQPDGATGTVPLGPHGVVACTAVANGWTAVAHPEADLVRAVSPSGVESRIRCYRPVRVAWAGTSLLVSTFDHELVLFRRLIDTLAASGDEPLRQPA